MGYLLRTFLLGINVKRIHPGILPDSVNKGTSWRGCLKAILKSHPVRFPPDTAVILI